MTLRVLPALVACAAIGASGVGCMATRTPVMNTNLREIDFTQEMKVGKSCEQWLLGISRLGGHTTLSGAVENGGLSRVEYVEESFTTVFLFWWKRCLIAYGH
jgi:hypothetical protein